MFVHVMANPLIHHPGVKAPPGEGPHFIRGWKKKKLRCTDWIHLVLSCAPCAFRVNILYK